MKQNSIALITGATSGIGEACARKFALAGYDLILNGRRSERLNMVKTELEHAALLIIDADGLKQVNDQNGHPYGDQYLKKIAELISAEAGQNGICARLGGDEFAILLYGCDSEEELLRILNNIEESDNRYYMNIEEGKEIPLRYSVGYAIYKKDAEDYHELLKYADERMYEKKGKKINRL